MLNGIARKNNNKTETMYVKFYWGRATKIFVSQKLWMLVIVGSFLKLRDTDNKFYEG